MHSSMQLHHGSCLLKLAGSLPHAAAASQRLPQGAGTPSRCPHLAGPAAAATNSPLPCDGTHKKTTTASLCANARKELPVRQLGGRRERAEREGTHQAPCPAHSSPLSGARSPCCLGLPATPAPAVGEKCQWLQRGPVCPEPPGPSWSGGPRSVEGPPLGSSKALRHPPGMQPRAAGRSAGARAACRGLGRCGTAQCCP